MERLVIDLATGERRVEPISKNERAAIESARADVADHLAGLHESRSDRLALLTEGIERAKAKVLRGPFTRDQATTLAGAFDDIGQAIADLCQS